ncbi:MAG: LD-carboxypeptidase [Bacteroidota bacterium]
MSNRRKFIKSISALTALSLAPLSYSNTSFDTKSVTQNIRIFPKRLKKGAIIGLIAPGGPITKKQLDETIEKVEQLGFKTYYTETVLSQYGYFAGKDKERADDLMNMFANENVDAILAVRGGYGAIRILDLLDYELIKQNPKVLIGYSDVTALHCAIYEQTGLITFHGPVGISSFNEFSVESLTKVLIKPKKNYRYPYEREKETDDKFEFDLYSINDGQAEGVLIGGNLSVLDSMIGSKFEPDFKNKIVYLEEISEKTYKVDKMLVHLLQATNLKSAAGIALGIFNKCDKMDEPRLTLRQALEDLLKPLNIPIVYGLPFGHISTKITLPTGIIAKLDADKNTLKLLEKAVR